MKLAIVAAALVSVTLASSLSLDELQFAKFRENFGKKYHTRSEHQRRFAIFSENLRKYEEHNKSGASWRMGNISKLYSISVKYLFSCHTVQ